MGIGSVSGFAPAYSQQAKATGDSKAAVAAPSTSTVGASGASSPSGPVDTVSLSPEAQLKMTASTRLTVTSGSIAQAAALAKGVPGLDADAQRFTPDAMAAHAAWREKHTEYMGKVRDLVDQTFGLNADENGWGASGSALTAIKNLAEKNGLVEPEMPPEVATMMQAKPGSVWGNSDNGTAGVFDIGFTQKGADSGGNLRILFDSNVKPGANNSLVDLREKSGSAQGLLSKIKNSPLDKALDSVGGWSPGGTANAYAISSGGSGADAKVVGLVLTENKDDYAKQNAVSILSKLHGLLGQ